jgi:hypothetical protein
MLLGRHTLDSAYEPVTAKKLPELVDRVRPHSVLIKISHPSEKNDIGILVYPGSGATPHRYKNPGYAVAKVPS